MLISQRPTIEIPSEERDPTEYVVGRLVGIGMLEDDARRLVHDELRIEPAINIPLSELYYGKKVGETWQEKQSVQVGG